MASKRTPAKAGKTKGAKPPKLDKDARKAASQQMWGDPSYVVRHLARLVVFLAASWPTLQSFSTGSIEPMAAAVRLVGAALFSLVSVALVAALVGGYHHKGGRRGGGR